MENIENVEDAGAERVTFIEDFMNAQKEFLGKLPNPEHFMNLIDQLRDLSEEEKEILKKNFDQMPISSRRCLPQGG